MTRVEREPTPEEVEKDMSRINKLLSDLKAFETDRHDERVDRALNLVRTEFINRPGWIPPGTITLYHGSLQYHDPVNLDLDLDLVVLKYTRDLLDVQLEYDDVFDGISGWPETSRGRCDSNTGLISLDTIASAASLFSKSEEQEDNLSAMDASIILSGKLLFPNRPDQQSLFANYQNQVRTIARVPGNSKFRKGIISELISVQKIRRERRGMSTRIR